MADLIQPSGSTSNNLCYLERCLSKYNKAFSVTGPTSNNLYSVIWKDNYPKKIKIFSREVLVLLIVYNDNIPHCSSSPSWCVMCLSNNETPEHLFGCSSAYGHWTSTLKAFGWSLDLPNNVFDLLALIFVHHSFYGPNKLLWLAFNMVLFWSLWSNINYQIFRHCSPILTLS